MAIFYLWSGATGAGTGADWANAFTSYANLIAAAAYNNTGHTIVRASDHVDTMPATSTLKGTNGSPDTIFTVNRTTGLPQTMEAGGGSLTAAAGVSIGLRGSFVDYGAFVKPGGGYSNTTVANFNPTTTNDRQTYINLSVELPNANSCRISGGAGAMLEIYNLKFVNCAANAGFSFGGSVLVRGSGQGPMFPKVMTGGIMGATNGFTDFDGVDWSNQTSGARLFVSNQTAVTQHVKVRNSVIHSAMTLAASAGRCQRADLLNCTDEAGNMRMERHWYEGTQTLVRASANPSAVRTGGAADSVGAYSWKIVTTANANRNMPFETLDLGFPVPDAKVGVSTTISFHTITDGVTLTDADARLLLGGAVSSNSALLTYTNDGPADPLATPVNQATSSQTWSVNGITTQTKQMLEGIITPTRVGPHEGIVQVGKPSLTMFVCPKPIAT